MSEGKIALIERWRGGAGDIIAMRPSLRYLKEVRHPDCLVIIRVPSIFRELVEDLCDLFHGYDDANDTWVYWAKFEFSGTVAGFYYYHYWCPAGWHELETRYRPTKSRIQNFCEFVGAPVSKPDLAPLVTQGAAAGPARPYIVVQCDAANPAKTWPREEWLKLMGELADTYTVVAIDSKDTTRCMLTGSGLSWAAYPDNGAPIIVADSLGHKQVATLVAGASAAISPDSYLLHVAGALDVPCVGLFGPTDGELTRMYYPSVRAVQGLPPDNMRYRCYAPCYYDKENNRYHCSGCPGDCMRTITAGEILTELTEAIDSSPVGQESVVAGS